MKNDIIKQLEEMEKSLQKREEYFVAIDEFFDSLPLPAWMKIMNDKEEFIIIKTNALYALLFGVSPNFKEQGLPPTDTQLWGEETAKGFRKNDLIAIKERRLVSEQEVWTTPTGKKQTGLVLKWPCKQIPNIVFGTVLNVEDVEE